MQLLSVFMFENKIIVIVENQQVFTLWNYVINSYISFDCVLLSQEF